MAGAYPDAPSRRMATDVDGTIGQAMRVDGVGSMQIVSGANMTGLNSENESNNLELGYNQPAKYMWYLFPELRDLDGIFLSIPSGGGGTPTTLHTSADTTNGLDGTWTQRIADMANVYTTIPNYRDDIEAYTAAGAKGIRINVIATGASYQRYSAWHTYGAIASGETPDRILFLDTDAADAVFTEVLDYGDLPRGTTQDRTIKLKNNSGSLTIETVQITAEALTSNAGGFYEFSDDDITYSATLAIGDITNGSEVLVYVRQTIPDAEDLSVQSGRFRVSHASLA